MKRVTFFTKAECTVCHAVLYVIRRVRVDIPFELETIDISSPGNERWLEAYREVIPVVHVDQKEVFRGGIDERRFRQLVQT